VPSIFLNSAIGRFGIVFLTLGFSSGSSKGTSIPPKLVLFPRVMATTVILFYVRVPVLSKHTVVALPIISQALRTRTKFLSFIIRVVANASVRGTFRRQSAVGAQG